MIQNRFKIETGLLMDVVLQGRAGVRAVQPVHLHRAPRKCGAPRKPAHYRKTNHYWLNIIKIINLQFKIIMGIFVVSTFDNRLHTTANRQQESICEPSIDIVIRDVSSVFSHHGAIPTIRHIGNVPTRSDGRVWTYGLSWAVV